MISGDRKGRYRTRRSGDDGASGAAIHAARLVVASNFQTRERANSSLDQVDTKMISEITLLSQSASTTRISVVNSDWLSNNWLC